MSSCLVFYEKESISNFYPLSLSHTTAELRCGILTLGAKWQTRLGVTDTIYLTRNSIARHVAVNCGVTTNHLDSSVADNFSFIDPCFLPNSEIAHKLAGESSNLALFVGGNVALVRVSKAHELVAAVGKSLKSGSADEVARLVADAARQLPRIDAELKQVNYLWDLVHENGAQIAVDFELLSPELNFSDMHHVSDIDDAAVLYNADDIYIDRDSQIDAQVVVDARGGPVFIGKNAFVAPHTRIEGPAYIGDYCQLVGGKIREGCSFGPHCRVGGEVEESIFQAYSNKYHEGFIGHAYIGEWVNLGALTTNSDLKNNYGNIKVEFPNGMVDTGLNKVGSFIGDHTKTGIGTLLNTGMVVGFASNIFGGGMVMKKSLPSFVWGSTEGFVDYDVTKALETAEVVMSRRGRELADPTRELFRAIFDESARQRASL